MGGAQRKPSALKASTAPRLRKVGRKRLWEVDSVSRPKLEMRTALVMAGGIKEFISRVRRWS